MIKVLVLGIGSPFNADVLGWQTIDYLEELLANRSGLCGSVDTGREDRPGLRLLEVIGPYDHVILVDAVVSDSPVGSVHHLEKHELLDFRAVPSTHAAGISEALAVGAALDGLPAAIELFGLEVEPATPVAPDDVARLAAAVLARLEAIAGQGVS